MSAIIVRGKNHPKQIARRGALDDADDRWTPYDLFDALHAEHRFTVDVAASKANAKCERYYTRQNSGLTKSWAGENVWCNPPYSDLFAWVQKARWEVAFGGCPKVVLLLPATRCEQSFWQLLIEPVRDCGRGVTTKFIKRRTRFIDPKNKLAKSPPFGCVIVTIVPDPTRRTP